MGGVRTTEFAGFATHVMPRLRNLALSMCGDAHLADDLVQITMEKMFLAWPRLTVDDPVAYARRVLVRALISERRRGWWRKERVTDRPPWGEAEVDGGLDQRVVLFEALRQLPIRQRHAVVLRYLEDLPVATVADLLSCSEGNVKRCSHDGLRTLRTLLADSTERTGRHDRSQRLR